MIEFLSSLKLNEIQRVDSPFNEDPQNIFFQGGPNFGKFRGNGQYQGHLFLCKSGVVKFRKRISIPTPWYQNNFDVSIFLHAISNFRKKNEKNSIFRPKFGLLPSLNIRTYSKIFHMTKRLRL